MCGMFIASRAAVFAALLVLAVSASACAAPVQWRVEDGGNNHFYDIVLKDTDFQSAKAEAATLSFLSVPGYLATPASADEAIFIWNALTYPAAVPDEHNFWLGAEVGGDNFGDVNGYQWVTGEQTTPDERNGWYIDWAEGSAAYAIAQFPRAFWTAGWRCQDYLQVGTLQGYVVEYPTVPEPTSVAALSAGLPMLGLMRRRR